tara:strand:+ start:949 stop:1191 length:243 start_codon:yes stop_codon:yes gene_type:complete
MEKKRKAVKKKVLSSEDMDNKATKPETKKPEKKSVQLDKKKRYTFVSNGSSKNMPKGSTWDVSGEVAQIFIKQGYGTIKE